MTSWALAFGWNWLLVPVAVWFGYGVCRAWSRPRVQYRSHSKVSLGVLIQLRRQEMLPPWRTLEEEWLVNIDGEWMYNSRGDHLQAEGSGPLYWSIRGLTRIALAKDEETQELVK